jgi:hypothetical protein
MPHEDCASPLALQQMRLPRRADRGQVRRAVGRRALGSNIASSCKSQRAEEPTIVTAIGSWLLEVLTSSVVVSVIVGLVIWALREWISTRLTASVRLETEQKLTSFRMRLDSAERQFSAGC